MGFSDFAYKYFFSIGRIILKLRSSLPDEIRKAGMNIHYEVYASIIGFVIFVLLIIFSSSISLIVYIYIMYFNFIPLNKVILLSLMFTVILVLVISISTIYPKLLAANRVSAYDQEIPYAVAYLSIMTSGGMSPYIAIERLGFAKIVFKKFSQLAMRFTVMVRAIGWDPLTALEDIAHRNPSGLFHDLVMGFIATLRAGGDIADYLNKKSRDLFNILINKIKSAGERMSVILESYLAVAFILLLTLNAIYLVSLSISGLSLPGMNEATLFISSYILLPFMSGLMLYLSDIVQYKEPGIELSPYKVYLMVSIPIMIILILFFVAPSFLPFNHPIIRYTMYLYEPLKIILSKFNINEIYVPGIGLSIALAISTIPAAISEHVVCGKQRKIANGIIRFLRDLVEIRKTGLSPEKCIISLSKRDYGVFSKYLREMAVQISLGFSLSKIYSRIIRKIKAWRARVFLYILTEAIEVGGGTPETLENIAHFAELTQELERERASAIKTLIIIPYLGAIVIVSSIILLTSFMATLATGVSAYVIAAKMVIPAAIINVYFMGLVAGKISTGTVSAGFKHASLLCLISLLTMFSSPYLATMMRGITGG